MKVSIAQFIIQRGDPEQNLTKLLELAGQASYFGASLLCLPEMVTTGFGWWRNREFLSEADVHRDAIAGFDAQNRIQICGTLLERKQEVRGTNKLYFFDQDGSVLGKHRKIHLFPLFHEDEHLQAGDVISVFDTALGRVGLGIC